MSKPGKGETRDLQRVLEALERFGVLLESDRQLPSVVSLMVGAPVRGSWWGHPRGHAIYRVGGELAHHPDVVAAKLISRKVTFVHRRLWPALVGVGTAGEAWQLEGLSPATRSTLETVRRGMIESHGPVARDLEARVLVHSRQAHTETGAHTKYLESWDHWARQAGLRGKRMSPEAARRCFEELVDRLNTEFSGRGRLPWRR